MKKILLPAALMLAFWANGQNLQQWQNLNRDQRKQMIEQLSPEDRARLFHEARQANLAETLEIPQEHRADFQALYEEYQTSQRAIRNRFQAKGNFESLDDSSAKQELEQSFEIGQALIENRRKYAEKFQQIMKPQQVLEMFQKEGQMNQKMQNRISGQR